MKLKMLLEIDDAPGDGWPAGTVLVGATYDPGVNLDKPSRTPAEYLAAFAFDAVIAEKARLGWH